MDRLWRPFSPLRAAVFAALFLPGLYTAVLFPLGWLGARPLTEAIHNSACGPSASSSSRSPSRPARQMLNWPRLIEVRRMVGVAACGYVLVHFLLYCADEAFDSRHGRVRDRAAHLSHHRLHGAVGPVRARRDLDRRHGAATRAALAEAAPHRLWHRASSRFIHYLHPVEGRRVGADLDGRALSLADGLARPRSLDAARAAMPLWQLAALGLAAARADRRSARRFIGGWMRGVPVLRVLDGEFLD